MSMPVQPPEDATDAQKAQCKTLSDEVAKAAERTAHFVAQVNATEDAYALSLETDRPPAAPRVYVRVRPLVPSEVQEKHDILEGLTVQSQIRSGASAVAFQHGTRRIADFTGVFGMEASNALVFEHTLSPSLDLMLNGGQVAAFCYGHTGTGKTHTMLGYGDEPGIYRLAATQLFEKLRLMEKTSGQASDGEANGLGLEVRFAELYRKEVFDLNDGRGACTLREDAHGNLHIRAATNILEDGAVHTPSQRSKVAHSAEEVEAILQEGIRLRAVGSSSLHEQSSRSHAVLSLEIVNQAMIQARQVVTEAEARVHAVGKARDDAAIALWAKLMDYAHVDGKHIITPKPMPTEEWMGLMVELSSELIELQANYLKQSQGLQTAREEERRVGKGSPALGGALTLVDLAGADQDSRDIGEKGQTTVQRAESTAINKSLLAVKECIRGIALKTKKHPFRDSTLTRVLKEVLLPSGREAESVMIATVSPSAAHERASVNTMRYARMVTGVKLKKVKKTKTKDAKKPWHKTKAK